MKLIILGLLALGGLIGWSWVRNLRRSSLQPYHGIIGWVVVAAAMLLLVQIFRVLIP